jgi:hypothetical protein
MVSMSDLERADYWRSMRAIMYQPTEVWLASCKERRWLTDKYVMLDVTGSEWFTELPDAAYKLAFVSKGPEPRDAAMDLDLDAYFESMNEREWLPATPTLWSVEESPNDRAMLWDAEGTPALMGRETWQAIKRYYPDCMVEHSWRGNSAFRFIDPEAERIFAYAAGIKMPEGQGLAARMIVRPEVVAA